MKTKIDVLDRKLGDLLNEVSPKAYKRILEAMQEYAEQFKWISVEDELPEKNKVGEKVLLWRMLNSNQQDQNPSIYNTDLVKYCDPKETHWQPLPSPLKEDK